MNKKVLSILLIIAVIFNTVTFFSISYADTDVIQTWAPVSNSSNGASTNSTSNSTSSSNPSLTSNSSSSANVNSASKPTSSSNSDSSSTSSANFASNSSSTSSELESSADYSSKSNIFSSANTEVNNPLGLTSGGAILIDQNSGEILYDYNMHQQLRPASVTKVMTLLLIMEALDSGKISLNDKIPCSENASKMGGSQIWLDTKEELTVDEMLKAICVVSANDCTVAMAEYLEDSQEAFVDKMNAKAKELGMNDTTFKNCHGIDEDGHVTSPYDIALMSKELLTKHPGITRYTTIYMDSLRDGKSQLVNTNKLVRNYSGCTGLKTGSTSVALFNLSASATRNGLSLIAVIMKAETTKVRFEEARKLLDYGFSNYKYQSFGTSGDSVGKCQINKGIKNNIEAVLKDNVGFVQKKTNSTEITQSLEIYNNIYAPIQKGQKIGEISFSSNNQILKTVDLVSSEDVDKYTFSSMIKNTYENWFTLLRVK